MEPDLAKDPLNTDLDVPNFLDTKLKMDNKLLIKESVKIQLGLEKLCKDFKEHPVAYCKN